MARKRSHILTGAELRLMQLLWQHGQLTVHQVAERLTKPKLAYNTVLTQLRVMKKKGYVDSIEDGRAHLYRPLIGKDDAAGSALADLLGKFFSNQPLNLALRLVQDDVLTVQELDELKKLARKKR